METKKQERWFRTDVNFENSFKFWFALQWQNAYLQLFVVAVTLLILQICYSATCLGWLFEAWAEGIGSGLMVTMGSLIPLAMTSIIAYKAFWQYFNDLKHGTSR